MNSSNIEANLFAILNKFKNLSSLRGRKIMYSVFDRGWEKVSQRHQRKFELVMRVIAFWQERRYMQLLLGECSLWRRVSV